jgi:hypothetical protein
LAEPKGPQPVKLLVGILCGAQEDLEWAKGRLEEEFGPIDYASSPFPFQVTDYYEEEMGPNLLRAFFSFARLIDPGGLASIKVRTNCLEVERSRGGRRRVNLDPGYLDYYKIVLASCKPTGQKIYLSQGIYADPVLYYDRGWKPYDWGFPDFRRGEYNEIFTVIRDLYKRQCRELRHRSDEMGPERSHHVPVKEEG